MLIIKSQQNKWNGNDWNSSAVMHDASGSDIRTGTRPFVSSTIIHLFALFQHVSMAMSGRHTKLNQSACLPQFLMSFPSASLTHTTYQNVALDPEKYKNVGFIQMMHQWKQTAAQLPNTFLRQSSETCFLLWSCKHPYLRHLLRQPLLCSNPTTTFSFWQRIGGCTPPGSSSAQVNLFMVAPLNPIRPR